MPVIRFSTHLNGDSLSDRYDLRMPIYGCADKLPSRSPSLKSVEKKNKQKNKKQQQQRVIIIITMTVVMSH